VTALKKCAESRALCRGGGSESERCGTSLPGGQGRQRRGKREEGGTRAPGSRWRGERRVKGVPREEGGTRAPGPRWRGERRVKGVPREERGA